MNREYGNTWLHTRMMTPEVNGEKNILPCFPSGEQSGGIFMNNPADGVKAAHGI